MPASFFWAPFETVINNYGDLVQAIEGILTFPKSPNYRDGWWPIDTGRAACSLALRPHKFSANTGAIPSNACYTFRISAAAKKDIRERLKLMFGYKHSTIYPDYTGFSDFAVPHLKRW